MIRVNDQISLDESEIHESFVRASGPGGQNVNKVATSVQLRFDAANSPSLPEEVRHRLLQQAEGRITEDGFLVIEASRFRTQGRNREDALERLLEMIKQAAVEPKVRHKTRPTRTSRQKRLESKHHTAEIKKGRRPVAPDED